MWCDVSVYQKISKGNVLSTILSEKQKTLWNLEAGRIFNLRNKILTIPLAELKKPKGKTAACFQVGESGSWPNSLLHLGGRLPGKYPEATVESHIWYSPSIYLPEVPEGTVNHLHFSHLQSMWVLLSGMIWTGKGILIVASSFITYLVPFNLKASVPMYLSVDKWSIYCNTNHWLMFIELFVLEGIKAQSNLIFSFEGQGHI